MFSLRILFFAWVALNLSFVQVIGKLFGVKGAGNVAHYDSAKKWQLLFDNKKSIQVLPNVTK